MLDSALSGCEKCRWFRLIRDIMVDSAAKARRIAIAAARFRTRIKVDGAAQFRNC